MPTGYTSLLHEKQLTFEEFVWVCARQFGAFVTMRDDDMMARIPERFEPDTHYRDKLEEARRRLTQLEGMTPAERTQWGTARIAEERAEVERWLAEAAADTSEFATYRRMLEKVRAWEPPADHAGLKADMERQLTESIEQDHSDFYRRRLVALECLTPHTRHADAVEAARRDVDYYAEAWQQEQERVDARNRWLAQLRASVPLPASLRKEEAP